MRGIGVAVLVGIFNHSGKAMSIGIARYVCPFNILTSVMWRVEGCILERSHDENRARRNKKRQTSTYPLSK